MVPVGLGQIVERMVVEVHAAGGDLVQQRLPQMGARLLDQRDLGLAAPAQLVAQPSHQLEPAGAATHHDDAMGYNRADGDVRHRPLRRLIGHRARAYSLLAFQRAEIFLHRQDLRLRVLRPAWHWPMRGGWPGSGR